MSSAKHKYNLKITTFFGIELQKGAKVVASITMVSSVCLLFVCVWYLRSTNLLLASQQPAPGLLFIVSFMSSWVAVYQLGLSSMLMASIYFSWRTPFYSVMWYQSHISLLVLYGFVLCFFVTLLYNQFSSRIAVIFALSSIYYAIILYFVLVIKSFRRLTYV